MIAFDFVGRNMYIGNRKESNFEIAKVDGKNQHRRIILTNNGDKNGVAKPKSMCLQPSRG